MILQDAINCSFHSGMRAAEKTPNNLLFPFASNIRLALQKSKTKHYVNNAVGTSKADVLLKKYTDKDKPGAEANESSFVVDRCSDVINSDGFYASWPTLS